MKFFLVVNPQSANGATGRRWPELSAAVGRTLGEFGHAFTERPMDAARLTRRALDEGYSCIVAVGGDGTVNEVVNGFFHEGQAVSPTATTLGVLSRGTGGDFPRSMGWEPGLIPALQRLVNGKSRPLDVGRVEFTARSGERGLRYFVNVCSFGVSGQVVRSVEQSSKALGGKASFYLGSFKAMARYQDQTVRCRFDGGPEEELSVTAVALANGRYFGGGMCVAPTADPSDGILEATIWSGYGLKDFIFRSPGIYSGGHVKWEGTRQLRCRKMSAESDEAVLVEVDGELLGRLPIQVEIIPGSIRLRGG